jgi:hypothetical protein
MDFQNYIANIKKQMRKFSRYFTLALLPNTLEYPVIKIFSRKIKKHADLVIVGGIHGDEPIGPLTIAHYLSRILKHALKTKINIIIYPLVNPYGIEKNKRFNQKKFNCNSFWIHEKGIMAKESQIIKNDIKKYKVEFLLSMHENGVTKKKKFFLYCMGNRQVGEELVRTLNKHKIPIFEKGFRGTGGEGRIKNGIIFNWHDGTLEDYISHRKAKASICTETHLKWPLTRRLEVNYLLIKKMMEIAANK